MGKRIKVSDQETRRLEELEKLRKNHEVEAQRQLEDGLKLIEDDPCRLTETMRREISYSRRTHANKKQENTIKK